MIQPLLTSQCNFGRMTEVVIDEAQFLGRIAKIRVRFASELSAKIDVTAIALQNLAGNGPDAIDAVATAYRLFHNVCGIGSTIGFDATGRMARALDAILVCPFRERRGLSADELTRLEEGLISLRIAALAEMQATIANGDLAT